MLPSAFSLRCEFSQDKGVRANQARKMETRHPVSKKALYVSLNSTEKCEFLLNFLKLENIVIDFVLFVCYTFYKARFNAREFLTLLYKARKGKEMIEIKNLVKRFGNHFAVDDISFTIDDGEIVGFLGPNGAGKSTTMNMITGYLSSTSGSVSVDGYDIFESPVEAKRLIGFLPEQPPLYIDMTVWEYLSFVYDLKGCDFNKQKHLTEVCELVKVLDVKNRLIRNLSKGYKQRVGIASALVGNPKIIILDEPTVGLDPKQIIDIRSLIRNLGKKHTVILSTHIMQEVQAVCERIIVINQGKIIADEKTASFNNAINQNTRYRVKIAGPSKEIMRHIRSLVGIVSCELHGEREGDAFSYDIESAQNIDIRKSLFRALADKGWPMLGMEPIGMELEDIFLKLINTKGGKK